MTETQQLTIGTVISDQETPTFEVVKIKLRFGQDVKPGTLVRIPVSRNGTSSILIARVRSAYENNPNERPEDISVRDTLGIGSNYPGEEDSTTIYRLVEAELIEEIVGEDVRSPQALPSSGAEVSIADEDEIVQTLGLVKDEAKGLDLGRTVSGTKTRILLKREAIQRHLFVCGTTGSGKSYAMGVVTEELVRNKLPVVFLDTQNEYSKLVEKLGGKVLTPGKDFNIRISSLTDRELIDLVPTDSELQKNIITAAFLELQNELKVGKRTKFLLGDLVKRVENVGPNLTNRSDSVNLAVRRVKFLERNDIFGEGLERELA